MRITLLCCSQGKLLYIITSFWCRAARAASKVECSVILGKNVNTDDVESFGVVCGAEGLDRDNIDPCD
jgi:hypothetical protein